MIPWGELLLVKCQAFTLFLLHPSTAWRVEDSETTAKTQYVHSKLTQKLVVYNKMWKNNHKTKKIWRTEQISEMHCAKIIIIIIIILFLSWWGFFFDWHKHMFLEDSQSGYFLVFYEIWATGIYMRILNIHKEINSKVVCV